MHVHAPSSPQVRERPEGAPPVPGLQGVTAEVGYLRPTTERPWNYLHEPPAGTPWQNCEYEAHPVWIADARTMREAPTIHSSGFVLWDAPTTIADFLDEEAVKDRYYAEAAELARRATGADHAYVFDHQVRRREAGRPALNFGRQANGKYPGAAGRIHNDYSENSGQARFQAVASDKRIPLPVGRFAIVNIWRSIGGPVVDTPLALCDARSISVKDLVVTDILFSGRKGEIYLLQHARRHRWAYFPQMRKHEALVFKQYDSQVSGVARFTPHTAFDLPNIPHDAPLRESIEIRCVVTYG